MQSSGRPIVKTNYQNSQQKFAKQAQGCGFCRTNGEMPQNYLDHSLKDCYGRVVCPRLRAHKCELCGATGDDSHTQSYCPWAQVVRTDPFFKQMFVPTEGKNASLKNMVVLKKTRVNSAGKIRRR